MSLYPSSEERLIYFRKGSSIGKKLGELRNEFLKIFDEMLWNKLSLLPLKESLDTIYLISIL